MAALTHSQSKREAGPREISNGVHVDPGQNATAPVDTLSQRSPSSISNEDDYNDNLKASIASTLSLPREILFLLIVCCAQLLTQAGLAQAIVIQRAIGLSLGNTSSPGELSWFAAGYSLTVGTFILIAGRLGDMYGHKRLFILGFAWFGVWSMVAGLTVYTQSRIFFDFCRAMQGIGPAVTLPNGVALLGRAYSGEGSSDRRRNMAFAMFGCCAPGGFMIGAVFASIFEQFTWWPWAFWTCALVCVGLAGLGLVVIPGVLDEETRLLRDQQSFDTLGAITGVAGLVLFNLAWNQAPVDGWGTPWIIVVLILGLLILGLFIYVETRAKQPLLPLQMLNSDTAFVLGCIAFGWSSFGIWMYYSWQFVQEIKHFTPLLGTAWVSPAAASGLVAALTTGYLINHIPSGVVMLISLLAFTAGNVIVGTMPIGGNYWAHFFISTLVTPWGMDISFPAATMIVSGSVPREHQGVAASLVNTVINYSISIGLGIAGTVSSRVGEGDKSSGDLLKQFRSAWYTGIALGGSGVICALAFIAVAFIGSRRVKSKGNAEKGLQS